MHGMLYGSKKKSLRPSKAILMFYIDHVDYVILKKMFQKASFKEAYKEEDWNKNIKVKPMDPKSSGSETTTLYPPKAKRSKLKESRVHVSNEQDCCKGKWTSNSFKEEQKG